MSEEKEIVFKNKENKQIYELLSKLVGLRSKYEKLKGAEREKAKKEYETHFNFLIKKFSYIPELHTRRYMKFSNYPDLLQEGFLGLVMALDKFDMSRSNNFFRIANWYVKTRVKRSANKFDVISVPMAVGKESPMCRVEVPNVLPDANPNQLEMIDNIQQSELMKNTISVLPDEHRKVFCSYHGFDIVDDEILLFDKRTIADISKEMNISRLKIKKILDTTNKKLQTALI